MGLDIIAVDYVSLTDYSWASSWQFCTPLCKYFLAMADTKGFFNTSPNVASYRLDQHFIFYIPAPHQAAPTSIFKQYGSPHVLLQTGLFNLND
jgi:hypothetical protein